MKNTLALPAAAVALLFTSMSAPAYAQSDFLMVGPFGFAAVGEVPGEAALPPLTLADVQTTLTSFTCN
jgi:hypothetical protein